MSDEETTAEETATPKAKAAKPKAKAKPTAEAELVAKATPRQQADAKKLRALLEACVADAEGGFSTPHTATSDVVEGYEGRKPNLEGPITDAVISEILDQVQSKGFPFLKALLSRVLPAWLP